MGSFIFLFSPIPLFLEVFKTKQYTKLPNLSYQAVAIMQLGFTIYGILINDSPVYYASGLGLIANFIYGTMCFILKKEFTKLVLFYSILVVLTLVYRDLSTNVLGVVACFIQMMSSSTHWEFIVNYLFYNF